ncbi:hypothetical protein SAMN05216189_105622 [Pseudomonas delhiensis]|uniref:Uncharacterized protein n=1 Tax=Pseudomonas delhiensis TaxID=366289 RepID=A0A239N3H6_9PSED|nr:hypothetical protein [Pseudomonas delhiensis]SDK89060.1 hypothetical protein SAMN05216189_105622 [Pseudomonas delhiensis]SNT49425.1 hypothetical protein SAMN06295949_13621 [Pseudomonas delhiensis]
MAPLAHRSTMTICRDQPQRHTASSSNHHGWADYSLNYRFCSTGKGIEMISSEPRFVFNTTRNWLLVLAMLLSIPCLAFPWVTTPAIALLALFAWQRGQCVYVSDSYSRYCGVVLFQLLFLMPYLAALLIFILGTRKLGWPMGLSLTAAFFPAALTLVAHHLVRRCKIASLPYEIRNGRVYPVVERERRAGSLLWTGLGVGSMSLITPALRDNVAAGTVMTLGASTLSAVIVLGLWRNIASLRQLQEEERRKGVRYTFANLEEIHAWRSRSYTARLFARLDNALGKRRG